MTTNIVLWKVGLVRCISLLIAGAGAHGLQTSIERHTGWNIENMSLPTSIALMLCAVALYILGYRTELANAKITEFAPERRIHGGHPAGDHSFDSAGQGRNCS